MKFRSILLLSITFHVACHSFALTPGDAVKSAYSTNTEGVRLDAREISQRPERFLSHWGVEHANDLKNIASPERAFYAGGQGELKPESMSRVIACRQKNDPTCLAVQILDRGFDDMSTLPSLPQSELQKAAELKEHLTAEVPASECTDIKLSTTGVKKLFTCRPGRMLEKVVCEEMLKPTGRISLSRFTIENLAEEHIEDCIPTTESGQQKTLVVECENEKNNHTKDVILNTKVIMNPKFKYKKSDLVRSTERLTCTKVRIDTYEPACPEGTSFTAKADAPAFAPDLPHFLKVDYECIKPNRIIVELDGEKRLALRLGRSSHRKTLQKSDAFSYIIRCSKRLRDEMGAYIEAKALIIRNSTNYIIMQIKCKIRVPDKKQKKTSRWQDNCAALS